MGESGQIPFRDARLEKYLAFSERIYRPADVIREVMGNAYFLVRYSLGGRQNVAPFPISELAAYFFEKDGSISEEGIPVDAPELPDEYPDLVSVYLEALSKIRPASRKNTVVLSNKQWKEQIEKLFPRQSDKPHLCACMPAIYVAYGENTLDYWGIYFNMPILADLFFNISNKDRPTFVHTAYALVRTVSDSLGNRLLADVSVEEIIEDGWRSFITFWANYWLAIHVLQDIYMLDGKLDDFEHLFDLEHLDAFRFATIAALLEGKSFGAQVVARPLLDAFKEVGSRKKTQSLSADERKLLDAIFRVSAFLTSYDYISGPDYLPAVSQSLLGAINGRWSAYWLAHASGTADPILIKTGDRYRGVRGFVRQL
ncbi:MAG: hypothetical protein PWP76_431 [Candidatus Diapherotrites archaeon]|nr:hypothetical protein [Candidatus Diapherotrites archaeon]MDN5367126.1 hypothetical protein [Candidatus Diapherotrites archaeon]